MLTDHQRQRLRTEECPSYILGQSESRVPHNPAIAIAPLLTCSPRELRPHPSYARHGLAVSADKLYSVRARGTLAFLEPLAITRESIIIDGYVRWELAK